MKAEPGKRRRLRLRGDGDPAFDALTLVCVNARGSFRGGLEAALRTLDAAVPIDHCLFDATFLATMNPRKAAHDEDRRRFGSAPSGGS